jgi:hypothetical protein
MVIGTMAAARRSQTPVRTLGSRPVLALPPATRESNGAHICPSCPFAVPEAMHG